ncbi:MAG: hypothetical protein KGJ87_01065 [Planctomycetota bacterium]|nr:hypothetical protein [Planctomycetota bacterium]
MEETRSWKEKIDPAFNEPIRVYLDFIDRSHINVNTGYLCLDNDSLNFLKEKGHPSLHKKIKFDYEYNKKLTKDIIKLGASNDIEYILKFFTAKKFEQKKSYLFKMIHVLPNKESKEYYRMFFSFFETEEKLKSYFDRRPEIDLKRCLFDVGMNILTLVTQVMFKGYWDTENDESIKRKRLDRLNLIKIGLSEVFNTVSSITHKKSLDELLEEAEKGNDESLFQAIQIDKTLFDLDWLRKRIRKAFYAGNSSFFKKLGMAIEKMPLENDIEYTKLNSVLISFWGLGLWKLNNQELWELLKSCGVIVQDDPESFRKHVRRLIENKTINNYY